MQRAVPRLRIFDERGVQFAEVNTPGPVENFMDRPGVDLLRFMEERVAELLMTQIPEACRLPQTPYKKEPVNCFLPGGGAIEANVREIEHPHGRFQHEDGTRFDVCIMELKTDPAISPPSAEVFANHHTGNELPGERAVDEKMTIGRQASNSNPRCNCRGCEIARAYLTQGASAARAAQRIQAA